MASTSTSQNQAAAVDHAAMEGRFMEICDVNIDLAREFLAESNWNLEAAVHSFFHGDDPETIQNQDNRNQELRHRTRQGETPGSAASEIVRPPRNAHIGWMQWLQNLAVYPLQLFYNIVTNSLGFLYMLLFNPRPTIAHPSDIARANAIAAAEHALRQQRERDRQIMSEQEAEYARSLAADQVKSEQQRLLKAKRVEGERIKREAEKITADKKSRLGERRAKIRAELLPEPPESADGVVTVRFKLPGGVTYSRRFDANFSLETLFNSVLTHELCPDDFSLISGYPAKTLNCSPAWYHEFSQCNDQDPAAIPTFKEADLLKSIVVLVRDNEA